MHVKDAGFYVCRVNNSSTFEFSQWSQLDVCDVAEVTDSFQGEWQVTVYVCLFKCLLKITPECKCHARVIKRWLHVVWLSFSTCLFLKMTWALLILVPDAQLEPANVCGLVSPLTSIFLSIPTCYLSILKLFLFTTVFFLSLECLLTLVGVSWKITLSIVLKTVKN